MSMQSLPPSFLGLAQGSSRKLKVTVMLLYYPYILPVYILNHTVRTVDETVECLPSSNSGTEHLSIVYSDMQENHFTNYLE